MTTNFSPRKTNNKLSNILFPNSTFTRNIHFFAENVLLFFSEHFLNKMLSCSAIFYNFLAATPDLEITSCKGTEFADKETENKIAKQENN